MKKLIIPILIWALVAGGVSIGTQTAVGQEAKPLDLTGERVTAEELITALTPKTRGLGVRPTETAPLRCEHYREPQGRGLGVRPAVAVKILFDFNSAKIAPRAAETLEAIGSAFKSDGLSSCCFQLEGHADNVGSDAYNQDLSERRAESVASYLVDRFEIDAERLLSTGFGESRPIASNDTKEGRDKNRRVQIVNLGFGRVEP